MDITAPNAAMLGNLPGAIHYGGSPGQRQAFPRHVVDELRSAFCVAYRIASRTVVRGGFGIFNSNYINQGLGIPSFGYATTASFSSADSGTTPAFNWMEDSRRTSAVRPSSIRRQRIAESMPLACRINIGCCYKIQWNFLIEHQFANDLSMSFAYVANAGRHLYASQNLNQMPQPVRGLAALPSHLARRPRLRRKRLTIASPSRS